MPSFTVKTTRLMWEVPCCLGWENKSYTQKIRLCHSKKYLSLTIALCSYPDYNTVPVEITIIFVAFTFFLSPLHFFYIFF